jgi:8-amino-7-oxononanoate synthase
MRTVLVTGSDTGIGKTKAVAALARVLGGDGLRVQVVKVVETGVEPGAEGDAARALRESGVRGEAFTLASFRAALAPADAAAQEGRRVSMEDLLGRLGALPACDWRICEGAGGISSPIDGSQLDWADFAVQAAVDPVVIVVPDRIGAINQGRLAHARARAAGLRCGVWLNAVEAPPEAVAASNRAGLAGCAVPVWASQAHGADLPANPVFTRAQVEGPDSAQRAAPASGDAWAGRCREELALRDGRGQRRAVRLTRRDGNRLDLAGNDYLELALEPRLVRAVSEAAARFGTSASASPLITGWLEPHERLIKELCDWHGMPHGMLWTSGYAANAAVLGSLPSRGEPIFADRLIHHSMIAGALHGEGRLQRYPHLDLDRLEALLASHAGLAFVATESVFSMDGDYPDLRRLAELRRRHRFCWILDEAHALGWYGPGGAGLARAAGVEGSVDVLVGTLGKTLASGGAYALFRDRDLRDFLVNRAGEFIYSTAIPPANAAAALEAVAVVRELSADQGRWQDASRSFRSALRARGWEAPDGDSPIVPVRLDDESAAMSLSTHLRGEGIEAAAVRPPTVPAGTSRVRFSLKRRFDAVAAGRVLDSMARWRGRSER